ncbi:MAG: hypothetical protein FD145_662 [Candidatus Saganbacteria bacterium]|uniref:DUF4135 domain-containing protein n=1 Tax=Candidatus Saganbacteria bacterium TaxID=2575572 RepID=A0A833L1H1_UNCSA|nr:MAG: hypothetical protein FD145_662 [Candidatus Saganbacteria bacterium]
MGVSEPLQIVSHDNMCGDRHVYIIIDGFTCSPYATEARFFYLAKDSDGNGLWQEKNIRYPGDLSGLVQLMDYPNPWSSRKGFLYRQVNRIFPAAGRVETTDLVFNENNWQAGAEKHSQNLVQTRNYMPFVFHAIDQEVCNMINNEGGGFSDYAKSPLFVNYTRRVLLQGLESKREYELFLKFGPSVSMEIFARKVLGLFNIFPPPAHLSAIDPYYVWIEKIDGDRLRHPWFDLDKEFFYRVIEERTDVSYYTLGNLCLLGVLGLSDMHGENIFFSPAGEAIPIDFETFCSRENKEIFALIKKDPRASAEFILQEIWDSISMATTNLPVYSMFHCLPEKLNAAFAMGLRDMFNYLIKEPDLLSSQIAGILSAWGSDELYSRALFRNTTSYFYNNGGIAPNYSFLRYPEEISRHFGERLEMVQDASSLGFEFWGGNYDEGIKITHTYI